MPLENDGHGRLVRTYRLSRPNDLLYQRADAWVTGGAPGNTVPADSDKYDHYLALI